MTAEQIDINKAFADWLGKFPRTSIDRGIAAAGDIRFMVIRTMLNTYQVDKLTELPITTQLDFAKALGITVPGPKVALDWGIASEMEPYKRGERQAVAERPGTNRIERFRQKAEANRQARWKEEKAADERGEFWTVVGAYYSDRTFLLVQQGLLHPDMQAAFDSQHTEAHMHLEPASLIGKISDVRGMAAKQFQGTSTNDLTIRVLTKKG